MKKLATTACIGMVFMMLFPVFLLSQDAMPQRFIVFEEKVAPSDRQEYMKVQQEAVDLWKKHKLEVPIYAYSNDENSVYWVVPIQNYASIDTLFRTMGEMSQKLQDEGYDGNEKFRDLSSISTSVIRWVPELSYHKTGDLNQSQELPYSEWMFSAVRSGHEKELDDGIKKFVTLYKDNDIDFSWDTFKYEMGNDMPAMVVLFRAKDPVDMYTKNAKINEAHGQALDKIWQECSQHVKSTENKTGWYMPQFTILPGE